MSKKVKKFLKLSQHCLHPSRLLRPFEFIYSQLTGEPIEKTINIHTKDKIVIVLPEIVSRNIYLLGEFEPEVNKFLEESLVVYDVGGHLGYTALIARSLVGNNGKVITFEPNSHFIKYIEKNISQHPNITLEKLAVSDNNEGMSLTYFGLPLAALTSSYAPRTNRRKVEGDNFLVDSTTIDDYVISSGDIPDLIKLDIEGGEMAALKGSINTIEKYKPVIILEGGDEGRNESTSTRSCLNFLTEQGYSFFEYDPKTNSIVTHKMKQKYKYCNILCRHISNHIKP